MVRPLIGSPRSTMSVRRVGWITRQHAHANEHVNCVLTSPQKFNAAATVTWHRLIRSWYT